MGSFKEQELEHDVFEASGEGCCPAWLARVLNWMWWLLTWPLRVLLRLLGRVCGDAVAPCIERAIQRLVDGCGPVLARVWNFVARLLQPLFNGLWRLCGAVGDLLSSLAVRCWRAVRPLFEGVWDAISRAGASVFGSVSRFGTWISNAVVDLIERALPPIQRALDWVAATLVQPLWRALVWPLRGLWRLLEWCTRPLRALAGRVLPWLWERLQTALQWLVDLVFVRPYRALRR